MRAVDEQECPDCGGSGVRVIYGVVTSMEACDHVPVDRPLDDAGKIALLREALVRLLYAPNPRNVLHDDTDGCAACEAERALEKTK